MFSLNAIYISNIIYFLKKIKIFEDLTILEPLNKNGKRILIHLSYNLITTKYVS